VWRQWKELEFNTFIAKIEPQNYLVGTPWPFILKAQQLETETIR
jgi:hypothetical protein